MSQHHTRALLELGRKAGLHTGELYRALTSRPPSPGEAPTGQADTNGYVAVDSGARIGVLTDEGDLYGARILDAWNSYAVALKCVR